MDGGMTMKQEERRDGIGGEDNEWHWRWREVSRGSSRCGGVYVIADIQTGNIQTSAFKHLQNMIISCNSHRVLA
jgi:hypothetical protein